MRLKEHEIVGKFNSLINKITQLSEQNQKSLLQGIEVFFVNMDNKINNVKIEQEKKYHDLLQILQEKKISEKENKLEEVTKYSYLLMNIFSTFQENKDISTLYSKLRNCKNSDEAKAKIDKGIDDLIQLYSEQSSITQSTKNTIYKIIEYQYNTNNR